MISGSVVGAGCLVESALSFEVLVGFSASAEAGEVFVVSGSVVLGAVIEAVLGFGNKLSDLSFNFTLGVADNVYLLDSVSSVSLRDFDLLFFEVLDCLGDGLVHECLVGLSNCQSSVLLGNGVNIMALA